VNEQHDLLLSLISRTHNNPKNVDPTLNNRPSSSTSSFLHLTEDRDTNSTTTTTTAHSTLREIKKDDEKVIRIPEKGDYFFLTALLLDLILIYTQKPILLHYTTCKEKRKSPISSNLLLPLPLLLLPIMR
jgi:hypothetical protein